MDTGFDSVKIIVIVLVVVVQGGASAIKWFKKQQELRRQADAKLGLPSDRVETASPETEDLSNWDPLGEQSEPEPAVEARAEPKPVRIPLVSKPLQPTRLAAEPVQPTNVAAPAVLAPLASMHRVIAAHSSSPNRNLKARLPGGISLRSAMLAQVILDKPVSTLRGSGRMPRI